MDIGLTLPIRNDIDANTNIEIGMRAEKLGFDSVWVSDHVVVPTNYIGSFSEIFHDPFVLLSALAGQTSKISLGTSLIILPYRNPIVVAKIISTLDQLSGGRVIFGIGTGWMKEEFETLGVPLKERGKRTNEYIEIIKNLWTEEDPEFEGEFFSFKGIKFEPKPVQNPYPPILVGGNSEKAWQRAVLHGSGWQPTWYSPQMLESELDKLKVFASENQTNLDGFLYSVRNRIALKHDKLTKDYTKEPGENKPAYLFSGTVYSILDEIEQFRSIGIEHILLDPVVDNLDDFFKVMEIISEEIISAVKS
ncbi:MAG: LLM class F420-dependent oxidoreductase [Candidatus Dadabacteria bacterium]|nr:LLM class F420-dependent oxidoreductase [Candidatus Dadabacteria bacterium]NIS08604.1 LLM class F420-dependent oxidoreductase [Candidatus Dadabacteria bacterium]NIV42387.1 TIGR03619 family F420-dependent LLM class oxidoreductase [Candidatus Dadabacteria bacterium]NIY22309.1 TIGR03619 family F420-dependent LLM class oxidoreductase [Candidatus Dadabacteria bacterium]